MKIISESSVILRQLFQWQRTGKHRRENGLEIVFLVKIAMEIFMIFRGKVFLERDISNLF